MKWYSRLRSPLKWAGLAASLLLAFPWASSFHRIWDSWWDLALRSGYRVTINEGCIALVHAGRGANDVCEGFHPPAWHLSWQISLRPQVHRNETWIILPTWAAIAFVFLPTALIWRYDLRQRRPKPGHCLGCGYDLTGNQSGLCPECGTSVSSPKDPTKPHASL